MFIHLLRAVLLGALGVAVGCSITWGAVSSWTSLSSRWISAGFVAPVMGLTGGMALADRDPSCRRGLLRFLLALASAPLCALGNYLSFLITSRTWNAEKIAPEHRDFFYQLTHPDVLPSFFEKSSSGLMSEQTWKQYVILGFIVGPIVLYMTTRK
jgi:hypothetical protein